MMVLMRSDFGTDMLLAKTGLRFHRSRNPLKWKHMLWRFQPTWKPFYLWQFLGSVMLFELLGRAGLGGGGDDVSPGKL